LGSRHSKGSDLQLADRRRQVLSGGHSKRSGLQLTDRRRQVLSSGKDDFGGRCERGECVQRERFLERLASLDVTVAR
jgi:hypothetical protein